MERRLTCRSVSPADEWDHPTAIGADVPFGTGASLLVHDGVSRLLSWTVACIDSSDD